MYPDFYHLQGQPAVAREQHLLNQPNYDPIGTLKQYHVVNPTADTIRMWHPTGSVPVRSYWSLL